MSRKMFQNMPKRGDQRRFAAIQEWRYSKDVSESRQTVETRLKVPASTNPPVAPRKLSKLEQKAAELRVKNADLKNRVKVLEAEILGWRQRVDALEEVIADSYVQRAAHVEVVTMSSRAR